MSIGGAGHIFDMIARMKANSGRTYKARYFKIRKEFLRASGSVVKEDEVTTKEQMERIKTLIRENRKKAKLKFLKVLSLSIILAVAFFLLVIVLIQRFVFVA